MDELFAQAMCQSLDGESYLEIEHVESGDQCTNLVQASVCFDLNDEGSEMVCGLDKDIDSTPEEDNPSLSPQKAVRSKRSAPVEEPDGAAAKRKRNPRNVLQLNEMKLMNGNNVACIFIKTLGGLVAVPLWSQYLAVWRTFDLDAVNWIVVGTQEVWLLLLVDHFTKKSCRNVAKTLVAAFRRQFHHVMATVRKANDLDGPIADDECDESPSTEMRLGSLHPSSVITGSPIVQVEFGQYTLTALNSKRIMALKVDADTVKFLTSWFVPFLKQIVDDNVVSAATVALAPSQDSPVDSFNMPTCTTPNVRGKVCWCPAIHTWKVYIENPTTTPCKTPFSVNPNNTAAAYEKEQIEKYWLAVEDWNRCDTSNRHRIRDIRKEVGVDIEPKAAQVFWTPLTRRHHRSMKADDC